MKICVSSIIPLHSFILPQALERPLQPYLMQRDTAKERCLLPILMSWWHRLMKRSGRYGAIVQSETIERYIREKMIIPDMIVQPTIWNKLTDYEKAKIEAICEDKLGGFSEDTVVFC